MVKFISITRETVYKHAGIFDKFTGDGFIAYFNESVCKELHKPDHIESFTGFLRDYEASVEPLFQDWVRHVKKIPEEPIGLALGTDIGRVSFQILDNHFVAVGDAIVWASRMASAAKAGEVLANNLLYQALRERKDLSFKSRSSFTKSGESFVANVVSIIHHRPEPITGVPNL